MYDAIVSLYSDSSACVKLNSLRTDWFDISSGVKQGDTLSPTLFNMYLNDLATEITLLNAGVELDDCTISLLLYADDIAKTKTLILSGGKHWCYWFYFAMYS